MEGKEGHVQVKEGKETARQPVTDKRVGDPCGTGSVSDETTTKTR